MEVFISHITSEAPLASVLKKWIEVTFHQRVKVFVSSEDDSIPPGQEWFREIGDSLSSTKVLLAICSNDSVDKRWINFEAGAGWIRGIPVIPICHSGMTVGGLPQPLSNLQALDVEKDGFARRLMAAVAKELGLADISPLPDHQEMEAEVQAALSQIAEKPEEAGDTRPNLKLVFGLDEYWSKERRKSGDGNSYTIHIGIQNDTSSVAEAALVELLIRDFGKFGGEKSAHDVAERQPLGQFQYIGYRLVRAYDGRLGMELYELSWPLDGLYRPIFRRVDPVHISEFDFVTSEEQHHIGQLFWRIQAPGMKPKTGSVKVMDESRGEEYSWREALSIEEDDCSFEIVDKPDEV